MVHAMPTSLPAPTSHRGKFPLAALAILLALCTAPIVALFSVGAILDRNCRIESQQDGEAGRNMIWRIEVQRCGDGPLVSNVLLAPRGKTLGLVASSTGSPRPVAVDQASDGTTMLRLEAVAGAAPRSIMLPLNATGRPAKLLVLADGLPKP